MRLTFAYDGVLFTDNEGNWYGRNYASLAERYSVLSEDITYLMRTRFDDAAGNKMMQMPESSKVVSVPDIMNPRNYIRYKRKAEKIIETQINNTDCLIVRLPGTIARIAFDIARKHKVPCIVEVVGCAWDSLTHHSLKGKIIAPLEFYKTKRAVLHSDYVIYVTNEFLEKRYPTMGKYAAISDVELHPISEHMLERKLQRKIEKTLVIGTAGAIDVAFKGQQYVIQAISKIKNDKNIHFTYRIAGGGNKKRLQDLAIQLGVEDRVVFDGSIPQERMSDWYDNLDIYVQPSTVEGMPRALLEAMSRGLPAIGSRVGGIPELIDKEALFTKGRAEELATLLVQLDKEKLDYLARENYKNSKEFTKECLSQKRNVFYSMIVEERGLH